MQNFDECNLKGQRFVSHQNRAPYTYIHKEQEKQNAEFPLNSEKI